MRLGAFTHIGGALVCCGVLALIGTSAVAAQAVRGTVAQARQLRDTDRAATLPTLRADGRMEFRIGRDTTDITVDGRMDESAWASAVVVPLPYEVSPAQNGVAAVDTECRLTYDADNLYLACTATDPDPDAIRAYVVDRDGIDDHDRVVLTLDPFDDQRRAFQFGVSALGVQSDAVLAQQGTTDPNQGPVAVPIDPSWDAIWTSAGTITADGFVVEAAIPFRSLRFPRTEEEASWGVFVTRWRPRSSSVQLRSTTWDRDDSCLLCQSDVLTGFVDLRGGANVQVTPTVTGDRVSTRPAGPGSPLVAGAADGETGLDVQWGITSDLMLNLTANPDFSQVEADVAQLDVNNRFALFFPEKRPFFLEGADFFGTPVQAVFTRSIADPRAGAKLTGKLGDNAAGVLVARDGVNNLLVPGSESSTSTTLDGEVTTAIARFRRDVGGTSTIGALVTARHGVEYHNRVGGVDAFYRPFGPVTLEAQLLRSETRYPDSVATGLGQPVEPSGNAVQLRGRWEISDWRVAGDVREIDDGFRADAGFVTQTGVRGGNVNVMRRFWGASDRWFSQIRLEAGTWRNQDFSGNQLNGGIWLGATYEGPWQTAVSLYPNLFMREHHAGTTFDGLSQLWFNARAAPSGALGFGVDGYVGDFVDLANARLGAAIRVAPSVSVRIGRNVEATLQHTFQRLDNDGAPVFTAYLAQLRTVYNFSARSFVRSIVQLRRTDRDPEQYVGTVDPQSTSALVQLLYSYKLNPQTVVFLGYGEDGVGAVRPGDLRLPLETRARTFFIKLGYAWRP